MALNAYPAYEPGSLTIGWIRRSRHLATLGNSLRTGFAYRRLDKEKPPSGNSRQLTTNRVRLP